MTLKQSSDIWLNNFERIMGNTSRLISGWEAVFDYQNDSAVDKKLLLKGLKVMQYTGFGQEGVLIFWQGVDTPLYESIP